MKASNYNYFTFIHFLFSYSRRFLLLFLFFTPLLISCGNKQNLNIRDICKEISIPCFRGKKYIEIYTNKGKIVFELDGEVAPLTVGNFLELASRGVYNKTVFHRVIKEPSPLIIQGGDSISQDENRSNQLGVGNFIHTDNKQTRFIPLEIKLKNEEFPRYGNPLKDTKKISNIILRHRRGSISMARSEPVNSASTQFFISLKALPELDGRYAVFGRLIKGFKILDLIEEGDFVREIIALPDRNSYSK